MHFISYLSYNNPKITPSDIYFFLPILTFRGAIFDFIGEILNNKYGPKLTILFGNTIFMINGIFYILLKDYFGVILLVEPFRFSADEAGLTIKQIKNNNNSNSTIVNITYIKEIKNYIKNVYSNTLLKPQTQDKFILENDLRFFPFSLKPSYISFKESLLYNNEYIIILDILK